MKKIITFIVLFFVFIPFAYALNRDQAINQYAEQLEMAGMDTEDALERAEADVDGLISFMESSQRDVEYAFEDAEDQVESLGRNDGRRGDAESALENARGPVERFTGMNADRNLEVQPMIAGSLPQVFEGTGFSIAEENALEAIGEIRRAIISPPRPGNVPTGDILTDFIPQIIRQLYRFAWVVIFISFVASGIMFIIAHDNEERINKAKTMITYSLIAFGAVALSFAIVKAVTDIDFFAFV